MRCLAGFDRAIEEVVSGREGYQVVTEVVGSVGAQAEVAVQQVLIGVVVILASADASLQAEQAQAPMREG